MDLARTYLTPLLCILFVTVITSCGGGGTESNNPVVDPPSGTTDTTDTTTPSTDTEQNTPSEQISPVSGQFIDSAVQGLNFITSTQTGTTDTAGTFYYLDGEMIDFYLGDIHLGGSLGASIITPVDLVPGALDETNPVALNIARFLQSLDDDLTPDNGILIIPAIANAAIGKSLNFSSSDFDTEANALLAELTSGIYVPVRTLVDSTGAADHLGGSITTELSGIYVGNISGDDSGTWRLVLGIDGTFSGTILSAALNRLVVSGSVSSDGTILGTTSPVNLTLDAQVSLDGSLSGSYRPSAGMLANLVGAREVIDPDTGTDPGTGGTGTGSGGTGTGGTGSGGTDPGTGTGGTGSGGAGTGTGGSTIPLGSISLTGPDTSATGNLYEPTMGIKETGAISYNTLGGNTGYATSLLILNLSPDDELIMATYSWSNGDKNNPATVNYTYSLLCPTAGNGDCSTVSIDVANNNIRFSNAYLNNVFADGTAPMTLNGTLNFVPVN